MTTITLKINEKSKIGKIILDLINFSSKEQKDVEVVYLPNKETLKAIENIEKGIGLIRTDSHEDLMSKLNS
jgi:antitoxin component of RelBE/YafQ-DinJ toxin-antitoxin module